MTALWQDARYALRLLWKSPGFTVVAILALTLGIGANTAIFSVVNAVLLRPLPYEKPEEIVTPWGRKDSGERSSLSYPDYLDWREQTQTLEEIAVYNQSGTILRGEGEPALIRGASVSSDLFPLLRIKPVMGRAFTRDEDQSASASVIVISYELWRRRFNSDPNIVGKQIPIGSTGSTVVGVLPPGFRFPVQTSQTDYLRPLAPTLAERATIRGSYSLRAIARLKPGVSKAQAESEMKAIGQRLEAQYPDEGLRLGLNLVSLHEDIVGSVRPSLLVLLGAVGFVLLIACANVANLLLARAAARQKEIAIRTALGAGRARLIRQLLTESTLLALVGGTLGLLLALWGLDLLVAATPVDIPRVREVGLDMNVFLFTLSVSVLTGVIFGLAPALQASRVDVNESLKEGGRGSTESARRNRVRSLLVISEIALSFVLLIGAGLLIKSFIRLRDVNPGFEPQRVLTTGLSLARAKYPKVEQQAAFFQETIARIKALPGVEAAALVDPLPLSGNSIAGTFQIVGRPAATAADKPLSNIRRISSDYFRTMSIPIMKGRVFDDKDTKDAPPVIVVNETFARRFFPGEDATGKRIVVEVDASEDPNPPEREIIGVVGDVRHEGLDKDAGPEFYAPYGQDPRPFMELVVRTATDNPAGQAASVREAIKQVDKEQYIPQVVPMTKLLSEAIASRRFNMMLIGLFAGVALLLASVGIYGVMSYSVSQRTHEIGIRLALGAQTRDVLKMVVGQGMALALIGVGVGLLAAIAMTRIMSSLLFNVSPTDAMTFVIVSLVLAGAALLACLIPARRATRVDPMVALRSE